MNVLAVLALTAALLQPTQSQPLKLKVGDQLKVTVAIPDSPFGGDYSVLSDGAIYGTGFGRIVVAGLTVEDAQKRIKAALKNRVQERFVFVGMQGQRPDVVRIVGRDAPLTIPLEPGLTVRKVLPGISANEDWDVTELELVRDGRRVFRTTFSHLVKGTEPGLDTPLAAEDILFVVPYEKNRVWVTGLVDKPGLLRMDPGATVEQTIAAAGGISSAGRGIGSDQKIIGTDQRIVLRRGMETVEIPWGPNRHADMAVQSGDVLTVLGPEEVRVTMAGEVARPGEVIVVDTPSLARALTAAGGINERGTLERILVFRRGEMLQLDGRDVSGQALARIENGDIIYVRRNEREVYVFGTVNRPGAFFMQDDREYHLSDALALSGGLSDRGSLRRVFLLRPQADGKPAVSQYNLDEFLKDGKLEANPELRAGDAILFGQPQGITMTTAIQAISSAVLVGSVLRR